MDSTPVSLLLRLKRPGADKAWRRFVELYTPLLAYWARQTGLQPSDAADLVQDVLAVLVQKLPEFDYDGRKSFRGWMRSIVLNRWRDQRRQKRAAPKQGGPDALEDVADPAAEAAFWEREHRQRLFARALELMRTDFEEKTWRACWECVAADRPAADVAAELGMTPNAVYIAKHRVLRHLRRELEGLLD